MNHFSAAEWRAYVQNELSEAKREEMERHLYDCGQCLKQFMSCVEVAGSELPAWPGERDLAQGVMEKILPHKSSFWDNVLIQYAVAASLTFLLLASGAFHGLLDGSSHLTRWSEEENRFSLTDTLMDKAVSVIEALSPVQDAGNAETE